MAHTCNLILRRPRLEDHCLPVPHSEFKASLNCSEIPAQKTKKQKSPSVTKVTDDTLNIMAAQAET